jgi:hypothetical protein
MIRKAIILSALIVALALQGGLVWGAHEEPIVLKGYGGKKLSMDSQEPYSPRQTCGECHEYDQITNGYHFQQGRTDASGKIVMSDTFNPKKPWILSDGMYGKW